MAIFKRKTQDYVSEFDKMSFKWNETHPLSASQKAEKKKYERIKALRDHPQKQKDSQLWKEF